jgi:outer membrane lipoprotein-sorting protein
MLISYPFTQEQALAKLATLSRTIQSLQTQMTLEGSALMDDKIKTSPTLSGTFMMQRPNRMFLRTTWVLPIFEMRSDGSDYEVYVNTKKRVYVGKEDGPPSKPIPDLGDMSNRLINLRPKQILEALVLDVGALLADPTILKTPYISPILQANRRYFVVDFTDVSAQPSGRLLQKIWFDLSMETPEVVRRQTFVKDGAVETDAFYSAYESVGVGNVKYPSKIELQFVETDTMLRVSLDPKEIRLNVDVDPEVFLLSTHPGAEVITFQPNLVSQQQ